MKQKQSDEQDSDFEKGEKYVIRRVSAEYPKNMQEMKSFYSPSNVESQLSAYSLFSNNNSHENSNLSLLAIKSKSNKIRTNNKNKIGKNLNKIPSPQSLLSKKPLSSLPPASEISFTQNIKHDEEEKFELDRIDDPIAYFSKHKDGSGLRFIHMIYTKSYRDPTFNPYDLKKVTHSEIEEDYFSMTAQGITHFDSRGNTDFFTLADWSKESSMYQALKKLPFFKYCFFWKPFNAWKSYVALQRFSSVMITSKNLLLFHNSSFSSSLFFVRNCLSEIESIFSKNLFPFSPQCKFKLEEFRIQLKTCINGLINGYNSFLNKISSRLFKLYRSISDPKNLEVDEHQFQELKRKNPNINQIISLEKKKDAEKNNRFQKMNSELLYLLEFIRLIDYMISEFLTSVTLKEFSLVHNIFCSEHSSMFLVEVKFSSNGNVTFIPSLDDLKMAVSIMFDDVFTFLNELHRTFNTPKLSKFFQQIGVSPEVILQRAPEMSCLIQCSPIVDDSIKGILDNLVASHSNGLQSSNVFADYYSLFSLGETWNVKSFLKTRSGEQYEYSLNLLDRPLDESDDYFLINYEKEPWVDTKGLLYVIQKLRSEEIRTVSIRGSSISGSLYIDSVSLRSALMQIPQKALSDIELMLSSLFQLKIDQINKIFRVYSLRMKNEATTLKIFVDICSLLHQIEKLFPIITQEISFLDEIVALFEDSGFKPISNPLHDLFVLFKAEYQSALRIKKFHNDRFEIVLRQLISGIEGKLLKLRSQTEDFPVSIKNIDIDIFSNHITGYKSQLKEIKPSINEVMNYQEVMKISLSSFSDYRVIKKNIQFSMKLQEIIKEWNSISNQISLSPFSHLMMEKLEKEVEILNKILAELDDYWKDNIQVLKEILLSFKTIYPYIPHISMLFNAKMQVRHWQFLYKECGIEGKYNPKVTINDLIESGVLSNSQAIHEITSVSIGENSLENEFILMKDKWYDIQIPLKDSKNKDEKSYMIGSLENLFADIDDSIITLKRMLRNKYIEGIKEGVNNLISKLHYSQGVLEQWEVFQSRWSNLYPLFIHESSRKILNQHLNSYHSVHKKWSQFIKFVQSDSRLFTICSYRTIMSDFREMIQSLDQVYLSLNVYIMAKCRYVPRLSFLSNREILIMLTTNSFTMFMEQLIKVMMQISRLDFKYIDLIEMESGISRDSCNFPGVSIFSLVGEDGDSLVFPASVVVSGSIESWLPEFFETISISIIQATKKSLKRYSHESMNDWIITTPSYICAISSRISFCQQMDDYFSNQESSQRVLNQYDQSLKQQSRDLISMLNSPLSKQEIFKISSIIVLLSFYQEDIRIIKEKSHQFSSTLFWKQQMKLRFNPGSERIVIDFNDYSWFFGGEFWGNCMKSVIPPFNDNTCHSVLESFIKNRIPLLFGQKGSGKTSFMKSLAMFFGQYIHIASSFSDMTLSICSRFIYGVVSLGSWLLFAYPDHINNPLLSYLSDSIHYLLSATISGLNQTNFNGEILNIKKGWSISILSSQHEYSTHMPPSLVSYCRPISFSIPSIDDYCYVKLLSIGFKFSKALSKKIKDITNSYISLIDDKTSPAVLAQTIVYQSSEILNQIIHSNQNNYSKFFESVKHIEEFAVAKGSFMVLSSSIDATNVQPLFSLLYSVIPLFDSIQIYIERILGYSSIITDQMNKSIDKSIREVIQNLDLPIPIDYFIFKVKEFIHLLNSYPIVIIVGNPQSGKSLLLYLYEIVTHNLNIPENNSKSSMHSNIKKEILFPYSFEWETIFGIASENSQWKNGLIHSIIHKLNSQKENKLLIIDGKADYKLIDILFLMISKPRYLTLNSQDSYFISESMKIIIETDSINNISPSNYSYCGICYMDSSFYSCNIHNGCLHSSSFDARFAFASISRSYIGIFDQNSLEFISTIFIEIVEKVFSYIFEIETLISINKLGFSIMCHICNVYLRYMQVNEIQMNNIEGIRLSLLLCCYHIVSFVLDEQMSITLDQWIRTTFAIQMPQDWVGFSVPDSYWDCYEHPSLVSVYYNKNKFIPFPFSSLLKSSIINGNITDSSFDPNNVIIPISQHLPALYFSRILIKNNNRILIHGSHGSGKSSFLKVLFSSFTNISPLYINLTEFSSTEHVLRLINDQTNLTSKSWKETSPEITVLVFLNVTLANVCIIEFIRMIVKTNQIPTFNENNHHILKKGILSEYVIIAVTNDISSLPPRFVSLFIPIKLGEYSKSSKEYIIKQILTESQTNSSLINMTQRFLYDIKVSFHDSLSIITPLCNLSERIGRANIEKISYAKLLLSEICIICFSMNTILFLSYLKTIKSIFDDYDISSLYHQINHEYSLTLPIYSGVSRISTKTLKLDEIGKKISLLSSFPITEQILYNYICIFHSLSRPNSSLFITGVLRNGKSSLIRLFTLANEVSLIELDDLKDEDTIIIKQSIFDSMDQKKKHIILYRYREGNLDGLVALYSFFVKKNIYSLFNIDELESQVKKLNKTDTPSLKQRKDALSLFQRKATEFCQIVFTANSNIEGIDLTNVDYLSLLDSNKEQICRHLLNESQMPLEPVLIKISTTIEESIPHFHSNMFYDFVSIFTQLVQENTNMIETQGHDLSLVLRFIESIRSESDKYHRILIDYGPAIQQLEKDKITLEKSVFDNKYLIEQKRSRINEETIKNNSELNRNKSLLIELEKELESINSKLFQIKQSIIAFSVSDTQKWKVLSSNQSSLSYQISKVFSHLIGSSDISEDYFTLITMIDVNDLDSLTINMITTIKNSEENNENSTSQIVESLKKYLEVLFDIQEVNERIALQQGIIDDQIEQINQFNSSIIDENDLISNLEVTYQNESLQLEHTNSSLDELTRQYNGIELSKKAVDSILKDISILSDKWKEDSNRFDSLQDTNFADSIIMASYLVFGGLFDLNEKVSFLSSIVSVLSSFHYETSLSSLYDDISDRIRSKGTFIRSGLNVPNQLLLDLSHLMLTPRHPLVIDPDGLIFSCLQKSFGSLNVSVYSNNYMTVLNDALRLGKLLLIFDVDKMSNEIAILINLGTKSKHMRIGRSLLSVHSDFRCVFFTNHLTLADIPLDMNPVFSIIDSSSSSLIAVRSQIVHLFVEHFDSDLMPRVKQAERAEAAHSSQLKMYENEALSYLTKMAKESSDDTSAYIQDKETIISLISARDMYIAALGTVSDSNLVHKELNQTIHQLLPLIEICMSYWISLSRYVSKIKPHYKYNLADFTEQICGVFASSGIRGSILQPEQIEILKRNLSSSVFQSVFGSLFYNDIMFFLFVSGFIQKGKSFDDLKQIIDHMKEEYNSKASNSYSSTDVNSILDSMKFCSIDGYYSMIESFVFDVFGQDITSIIPYFQIDSLVPISSNIPTLVFSSKSSDFVSSFAHFVSMKHIPPKVVVYTILNTKVSIDKMKEVFKTSTEEGNWLVINYNTPDLIISSVINDIIFGLSTNEINSEFRLIINAHCSDYLSRLTILSSKKVVIDNFPLIRHTVLHLLNYHGASIRSNATSKVAKRLVLLGAVLFALIRFRSYINPIGFHNYHSIQTQEFLCFIEGIHSILEGKPFDIPFKNLRDYTMSTFFGSPFIEKNDRRMIKAYIFSLISSESCEDSFSIVSPNSPEAFRWVFPSDAQLNMMINSAQRMVSFPSTDSLFVTRNLSMPYRNWTFSRWICQPFLFFNICHNKINIDAFKMKSQLDSLKTKIPKMLEIEASFSSNLIKQFWINEAALYNSWILYINSDLGPQSISHSIIQNIVPDNWKRKTSLYFTNSLSSFILYLQEKYDLISKALKTGYIQSVDARLLSNIRRYLISYLITFAAEKNISTDQIDLEFKFNEPIENNALVLTNLYMLNGAIQNGILVSPASSIISISNIQCRAIMKDSKPNRMFNLPFYRTFFVEGFMSNDETEMIDDETKNFVWDISVPFADNEKKYIFDGTSLYALIPEVFQ